MNFFKAILDFIYGFTHSWGWSIIILTLIIKLLLFPSTVKQFRVMSKMKELGPKLKTIQEKYKDNPEELNRRTMEIYKTEKVNPFSSCLPMLIQLPILLLFYRVLQDPAFITELGDATFFGIVLKDSGNLTLAIISGASTFLQQKLTMAATDNASQQKTFLYIMPVMLGYFTYQLNAGIGLYWVASNVLGIIQQYVINEYCIVKEQINEKKNQTQS